METIKNRNKNLGIKVFVGGIFFIFGIATLDLFIGYFFLTIALAFFTYQFGIEIKIETSKIRSFWSLLGVKKGKWESLSKYNAVSIRKNKKGIRRYGNANSSIDTSELYYEVLIVNTQHLKTQVCLLITKDEGEAKESAKSWSKKLDLPYHHYGRSQSN